MKAPTDFRNATFESLHGSIEGLRLAAYQAWLAHGPGTTRAVAAKCGMDLLTFRPRTTELVELGLVRVQHSPGGETHEGVYCATGRDEWQQWREARVSGQQQLL